MNDSNKCPTKMTIKQAAELFFEGNVSEGLLYSLVKQKKIPHVSLTSGKILFDKDQLEKWWNEHLLNSTQNEGSDNNLKGKLRAVSL